MDLLEYYIKEVISIEPVEELNKKFNNEFLKIKAVVDGYGGKEIIETIKTKKDWEEIKERGYFLM